MSESFFKNVEMAPPIQVFQLTKLYNESQNENKINLGVGAYRTDEAKPWVLPVVHEAEKRMADDLTLNHEYLPVAGMPDFRKAATKLLLGSTHSAITSNKTESFQCLGGTGCLRLGANFLNTVMGLKIAYVSNPTWGNHVGLFKGAGFTEVRQYRYWDNATKSLDINGMLEDLSNAPENAVIILHAVAHNPTGMDPTNEQWQQICKMCIDKKLFVFLDCAYQGFASGDIDQDGYASRLFADQDMDLLIAQSFSKNFGLYNERVGNLVVVSKDPSKMAEIRSQMEILIRVTWSNPPNHGARIVATVLNNKALFESWKADVATMANRIKKMRQELCDALRELSTPGNWGHITSQIGMFSFTGLNEKQVEMMKTEYHIFLLSNGRISLAGITTKNVGYLAKAMDAAVRAYPTLGLSKNAGEPGKVTASITFLEFTRRKLKQNLAVNIIETTVMIDGDLLEEKPRTSSRMSTPRSDSVEEFVKVRMEGSLSSLSFPSVTKQDLVDVDFTGEGTEKGADMAGSAENSRQPSQTSSRDSAATIPGTGRETVATSFRSRGAQTEKKDERQEPVKIPAVFQGTMITPVFFNGMMISPSDLDEMVERAAKGNPNGTIPVTFHGNMLASALGEMPKNKSERGEKVPVKFQGTLKGVLGNGMDLPVAFDGSLTPTKKVRK